MAAAAACAPSSSIDGFTVLQARDGLRRRIEWTPPSAPGAGATSSDACGRRSLISWRTALDLMMRDDGVFADVLTQHLQSAKLPEAIFWESVPLRRKDGLDGIFEFVVRGAPRLEGIHADSGPFSAHLAAAKKIKAPVATFLSLGRDSTLVAPVELISGSGRQDAYAHLASFVREAPAMQTRALWRSVAVAARERLGIGDETPPTGAAATPQADVVWLSTSGLGVYWLHVRVDTRPKYYTTGEYRDAAYTPAAGEESWEPVKA